MAVSIVRLGFARFRSANELARRRVGGLRRLEAYVRRGSSRRRARARPRRATSTTPTRRPGDAWCSSKPTQPNWSTSTDASVWPKMIAAASVTAPSFGARDDRAGDVERAEQAADPDPPGHVAEARERRQRLPHERRDDQQRDRPDEERDERGADRASDPVRELCVDAELDRQHRAGRDGEEQIEPQSLCAPISAR